MSEEKRKSERRAPFIIDEAKFSTQKIVTYIILLIFASVVINIMFFVTDQAERSTVLQTVINLTFLAAGFWLGASKQAQDSVQSAARIAENPPRTP